MDCEPCSSSQQSSPPKRRKSLDLGHLALSEKQTILNLYKQYINDENPMKMTAIVNKIVEAAGVAKSTVYRVVKEYKDTGKVTSAKKLGGRPALTTELDDFIKVAIRQIVHSFFYKNEIPTLNKILSELHSRPELPKLSRSSLYKVMKKINFRYIKRNRKSILTERDDIIVWRRQYLRSIQKYRSEGRPIFYLDETWVNEGHTKDKVWVDKSIHTKRQAFIEGLTTGLKNPSGKGRRLIILHVGSELGFVSGGLLIFEGKKTTDYHEEMNAKVFEEWFQNLLQKLPDNAVIVMDNASYHSRKVEKVPTTSSTKKQMQSWLALKNIVYEENMVRSELLTLIKSHKANYDLYACDELAKKKNKIVLRLPPYHAELNPIELIWAQIKNEVASKNTTFKLVDVKKLLLEAIQNVTITNWKNCVQHIIKEETKMNELDGIIDKVVEPLLISVNNESDTSTIESSDEDDI